MAVIYTGIHVTKLKDKEILKKLGINILCILCISAFFWVPMLEAYTFTEYEVYRKDAMATQKSFNDSGLDIKSLLYTDTEDENITHIFEIGIPILVMLGLAILAIKKVLKSNYKKEYILFFILGIICTMITIKQIPWGIFGKIFQIIQFKWRILLFSNFFFAIICAINMYIIIKQFHFKDVMVLSTISLLYIAILIPFVPKNSEIKEIDQYTIGEVTENQTQTIIGMGKGEYLPVKSNKNREYIRTREDTIYVIKGTGNIEEVKKNGQYLTCTAEILENDTILEFPYMYYPGYKITVNNEEIAGFESENGFLAISISESSQLDIVVKYTGTNLMMIAKVISGISFLIFIGYIFCDVQNIRIKKDRDI